MRWLTIVQRDVNLRISTPVVFYSTRNICQQQHEALSKELSPRLGRKQHWLCWRKEINLMETIFRSRNLHRIEQICASLTALKRLGDQFIVRCQMCSTVNARVRSICRRQIGLKRLDHFLFFLFGSNDFPSDCVLGWGRIYCSNYELLKGLSPSGCAYEAPFKFQWRHVWFLNEVSQQNENSKLFSASTIELFLYRWMSFVWFSYDVYFPVFFFFSLLLALCD